MIRIIDSDVDSENGGASVGIGYDPHDPDHLYVMWRKNQNFGSGKFCFCSVAVRDRKMPDHVDHVAKTRGARRLCLSGNADRRGSQPDHVDHWRPLARALRV